MCVQTILPSSSVLKHYFSFLRSETSLYHRVSQSRWSLPAYCSNGRTCLFLPQESLSVRFRRNFTIFTDTFTQGWGAHMGDSQISGTWTPLDHELRINCLELKAVGAALHHWVFSASGPSGHDSYGQFDSFIYQQARRDPVPHIVTSFSGAFHVVTGSEHTRSSPSKTHSRLSERDSRPPISSQSADNDRVESPSRNGESNFQILGDSSSGHVCKCFKLPPFSVHISNSGATSTRGGCSVSGREGRCTCFHHFPCTAKSFRNYRTHRRQR